MKSAQLLITAFMCSALRLCCTLSISGWTLSGQDAPMGSTFGCDTGKDYLQADYEQYCSNLDCKVGPLKNNNSIESLTECKNVGKTHKLQHVCLEFRLTYDEPIPFIGDHRPVWPDYGEYSCLPHTRWLHSIEHGAIVMLYHPCADKDSVDKLRKIVTGCLRRHVISMSSFVTTERPLVLVAWGCRYSMNTVDENQVKSFIKNQSLHGNEYNLDYDGGFNDKLLVKAKIVSDYSDTKICPDK